VLALLRRLGAPDEWLIQNWESDRQVAFGPTADRRVVGSMNELAFQAQVFADGAESFERLDLDELELQLAETPLSLIHYRHPAGVAHDLFTTPAAPNNGLQGTPGCP
jgi:hypothetical protein